MVVAPRVIGWGGVLVTPAAPGFQRCRGRAAIHLKTGQHFDVARVPADPGFLHARGPVRGVELCPLALKLGSGGTLILHAALVRVAILRAERLRFATGRLNIEARKLLSNADASG